ncbi:MAG: HNH endonuclease signature motif containing protein [Sporichthyaceae bacterium]
MLLTSRQKGAEPSIEADESLLLSSVPNQPATATGFFGAHTYTPSAKLARAIKARDKHCRIPGCRVPAARCELDHTFAFRLGGTTVTFNLACVCKFHHGVRCRDVGLRRAVRGPG